MLRKRCWKLLMLHFYKKKTVNLLLDLVNLLYVVMTVLPIGFMFYSDSRLKVAMPVNLLPDFFKRFLE